MKIQEGIKMDKLSILNIEGHPIDAIMYADGTMAKHVALGHRVCTMAPYHGMRTHLKGSRYLFKDWPNA